MADQTIKVAWTERNQYSVEIPVEAARELYNQCLNSYGGIGGIDELYEKLPADASPQDVVAALAEFNDLENQLADYEESATVDDGPYREIDSIELAARPVPAAGA